MLAKDVKLLPAAMQNRQTEKYLAILTRRKRTLVIKRIVDIILSLGLLAGLSPLFLIVAALVGLTSGGGVFYKQERVKQNMESFMILKFRTMTAGGENKIQLTAKNDARITKAGRWLRWLHLDEMPQLINVLKGDMSLVGPRPEVARYVKEYNEKWLATLLVPCGITCTSSIYFRNENEILEKSENVENCYINEILPKKMEYNLRYIRDITIVGDFKIMLDTILCVFKL